VQRERPGEDGDTWDVWGGVYVGGEGGDFADFLWRGGREGTTDGETVGGQLFLEGGGFLEEGGEFGECLGFFLRGRL
jgi:hypothetical protein